MVWAHKRQPCVGTIINYGNTRYISRSRCAELPLSRCYLGINPRLPKGGVRSTPPLCFFVLPPTRGGIWSKQKWYMNQIHLPTFKKKSHVISSSRFPTVITFSRCIGGGSFNPPPKLINAVPQGGGSMNPPLLSPLFTNRFPWNFHIMSHIM